MWNLLPGINPSVTEQTTALTDAILAVVAVGCAADLWRRRARHPVKARLWTAAFGALAAAAMLGTVAHGLDLSAQAYFLLWQPLNVALAATVAFFIAGTTYDLWGQQAARRALAGAAVVGVAFVGFTLLVPGTFLVFVLYQTVGMLFALGVYSWLARHGRQGAALLAGGILVTIVAAGLQATRAVTIAHPIPLDHNGVFHLVQLPGVLLIYAGVRQAITAAWQPLREWVPSAVVSRPAK